MNYHQSTINLTREDLDLLWQLAVHESRESFWKYRQFMDPKMRIGWFQREVAAHFQQFYSEMVAGKRPILILMTPPQHGKSFQVIDLISWIAGKNPDLRTIFASFSDRLGVRANLRLQRRYDSEKYRAVFPGTKINTANVVTVSGQTLRNREILEYVGREGYFRNTTVNGPITGEGLDLGIVDDPIKGRAEASSPAIREKTWDWLTDDFFSRFSENAGLIMTITRWHLDDPAGRLIERTPGVKVLQYPAIAERDERHRRTGEPLFPELKSLQFLLERKGMMTQGSWESEYQQNPIITGGGIFPVDKFRVMVQRPPKNEIKSTVRYWDKAGTEGGGAFTAGVKMSSLVDGTFLVEDVRRGQWSALERERHIRQTAEIDNATGHAQTWVEQEPGSGGKESAESTVRNLAGFSIQADRVGKSDGNKIVRAEPYAAQVQAGNVWLLAGSGEWHRGFIDEHEKFPNGKYKDQVDAAAGSFNKLTLGSQYDVTGSNWV